MRRARHTDPATSTEGPPFGGPSVVVWCGSGSRAARCDQKVALSPQAQEPEALGFSMEKPLASSDSFQSMTAPWM